MECHAGKTCRRLESLKRLRSLVPAHAEALQLLVNSNTQDAHWRNCWMDVGDSTFSQFFFFEDDDLDELYEDVVDTCGRLWGSQKVALRLQAGLREVSTPRLRSRLEACRKVMRECRSVFVPSPWCFKAATAIARSCGPEPKRFWSWKL